MSGNQGRASQYQSNIQPQQRFSQSPFAGKIIKCKNYFVVYGYIHVRNMIRK